MKNNSLRDIRDSIEIVQKSSDVPRVPEDRVRTKNKDWEVKKLGEVLKLEYGKPLPKEERTPDGKYPAYGANGVKGWSNKYYYDKKTIILNLLFLIDKTVIYPEN